eukprot:Amastigsp_a841956_130.p4 type:complete len:110 gc:universal Amastigsp_a841956_130:362-33(-)
MRTLPGTSFSIKSIAFAPARRSCPMCDTSKSPAFVRTWWCDCSTPSEYCTGIDQPAYGTMRAPSSRCRSCSAVFLSGASVPYDAEAARTATARPAEATARMATARARAI